MSLKVLIPSLFLPILSGGSLAAPGRAAIEPAQQDSLDILREETDGSLEEALATALDGRDHIDGAWSGESRVARWTLLLKEFLVKDGTGGQPAGSLDQVDLVYHDRRAEDWSTVFDQGGITISRRSAREADTPARPALGRAQLRSDLLAYEKGRQARVGLKIVAIDSTVRAGVERSWTDVRASAFEVRRGERVEHNALWRVGWEQGADGSSRMIEFIWLEEERSLLGSNLPTFADRTATAFDAPLSDACAVGLESWRRRLDSLLGTGLLGHHGFAFGDINSDGWDDLYVCQPGGLPNRLFLSHPDGTLSDRSTASGADFLDSSPSALLLHLDDDEHFDLALATADEVLLLAGDGKGHFELRNRLPASTTTSLSASDFDLDGDLDIYVCGYVSPYDGSTTPLPYHDANNGHRNQLLRNDGSLAFVDVTVAVGLDQNNRRFSFAAAWADHDHDGDPDLYVANDFGRNNLYRNDEGSFVDVAATLGVEDISAGMGVAWGDVDNDGWDDLYVSNMFSSAGGRIAYEQVFQPSADPAARDAFRRHARGNSLFRNNSGKSFTDVTGAPGSGAGMGRWAWGSILFDANDDGRLDVFVPNGMITGQRDDDL